MDLINKKKLKKLFKKKNAKIGDKSLKIFMSIEEENIKRFIEKAIRSMIISGRKTINPKDLTNETGQSN